MDNVAYSRCKQINMLIFFLAKLFAKISSLENYHLVHSTYVCVSQIYKANDLKVVQVQYRKNLLTV